MSKSNRYEDTDLAPLRALSDEMPTTRIGLVRHLWPDISAALGAGHSLLVIHRRLSEGGFEVPYRTLVSCVNRIRLERGRTTVPHLRQKKTVEQKRVPEEAQTQRDPLANLKKYGTESLPRFEWNGIPDPKKLF